MNVKNELTGFVIYEPRKFRSNGIAFSVNNRTLRFTTEAVRKIRTPECVNIFFDDTKKRMLVTAANEDYKNVFRLRKPSNRISVKNAIFCADLCIKYPLGNEIGLRVKSDNDGCTGPLYSVDQFLYHCDIPFA